MKLNRSKIVGLVLVVLAVVVSGVATTIASHRSSQTLEVANPTDVTGYLGGEKISLFDDPEFNAIASRAGLNVNYKKAGSLAMMTSDSSGMDYLFPSSQSAVDYGESEGVQPKSSDIVFNTPIVVYTYKDIADALVGAGIMSKGANGVYALDVKAACDAMLAGKTWTDLGYANGYGDFKIDSTDPTQSNSGNEWAVLMATVLNGGQPATADSIQRDAASLKTIFAKSGWMDTSSADSFSQFLVLGKGSKPMMVGYESQILDLAANEPDTYAQVKDDLVIAYTTPTIWSTHVFMALDDSGQKLRDVLLSDDVQKLAWQKHGFRGANLKGTGSVTDFGVTGAAESVPAAIDLPTAAAMKELVEQLGS